MVCPGTAWKHQQSWLGHSFPEHQSWGLVGLNEQSRRVSIKSIAVPSLRCGGGLSPHSGCSQLAPTGCEGSGVLITSNAFKDIQLWVF